jgi:hypothetical protein
MQINSNDIFTFLKTLNQSGGYVDLHWAGTDSSTTGRLSEVEVFSSANYSVEFTSTTDFTVKKDGSSIGIGTVGTLFTNSNINLKMVGVFTAVEVFYFTGKTSASVEKDTSTELVFKLAGRNGVQPYVAFAKITNGNGTFLKGYVLTAYNADVSLESQATNGLTALCPLISNATIDVFARYTGENFVLSIKQLAKNDWLSLGFFDLLIDPAKWSHPLHAGGSFAPSSTSQSTNINAAYFSTRNSTALSVRSPNGLTLTSSATNDVSCFPLSDMTLLGAFLTTDETNIAQVDLLLFNGNNASNQKSLGFFGILPGLSLGFANLSDSAVYTTKTKKQIIGWSGAFSTFKDIVLFDVGFGAYQ